MEFDWGPLLAGFMLGVLSLATAWGFSSGRYRYPARNYWDDRLPWYIRNIPFGLGPIAGFFLLGSSLPFVTQLGDLWGAILAGLIVLGGIGSLLLALRWMRFPPRVLKPGWLVEAERDRPPPEDAIAALRLIDRVFIGS